MTPPRKPDMRISSVGLDCVYERDAPIIKPATKLVLQ